MVFHNSLEVDFLGKIDVTEVRRSPRTQNSYEELFALMREVHQIGDWHVDLASGTSTWSDETYLIHGLEPSDGEVPLEAAISRYEPSDAEAVRKLVSATASTGQSYRFRLRLKSADGKVKLVESIGAAERDATGNITGLKGVFLDVSEEELTSLKALHFDEVVKSFSKHLPVSMMVLNPDLDVLQASDYALHEFGVSRKALLKNNLRKVFPDLPSDIHSAIRCGLKGKAKRVRDCPVSDKEGAAWYNWTVLPWRGLSKNVIGVVLALQSQPVKPQPASINTVVCEHHKGLLDHAPVALLSINPVIRQFDFANHAACHLLGRGADQLIGSVPADEVLPTTLIEQLEQDLITDSVAGPYEAELACGVLGKRLCSVTGSVNGEGSERRLIVNVALLQAPMAVTPQVEEKPRGVLAGLFG